MGPKPRKIGPRRVGPRRVWGPKFRAFFPSPTTSFRSFSLSLCVFSWNFGGVAGAVKCARLEFSGWCVKPRRPQSHHTHQHTHTPTHTHTHQHTHNNTQQHTTTQTLTPTPTPTTIHNTQHTTQHNTPTQHPKGLAKNGLAKIGVAKVGHYRANSQVCTVRSEKCQERKRSFSSKSVVTGGSTRSEKVKAINLLLCVRERVLLRPRPFFNLGQF